LVAETAGRQEGVPKTPRPADDILGMGGPQEGRRIDWILYRGDWKVNEVETVDFNIDGQYPMDCYQVFAIFGTN